MRIIAEAALGLDHAHAFRDQSGQPANLVHRDVSPDNLFVTTAGAVKLLDFGIAKLEGLDNLTQTGELKGKVPFMSPEQLMGTPLDARSDLFSMGIVLYWLLVGRRPFDGASDVHTMKAILEDPPRPLRHWNPRVPVLLEQVVMSLLEKDRDKRMGSAAALHDALMTLLVGLKGAPPPNVLVDVARTLPVTVHEVTPPGLAAVPSSPWPNEPAVVDDLARAATRARAVAPDEPPVPPPNTDESQPARTEREMSLPDPIAPTQRIQVKPSKPGAGSSELLFSSELSGEDDIEKPTQLVDKADLGLPSTDEHKRVSLATRSDTSTEAAPMVTPGRVTSTDPADPAGPANEAGGLFVQSEPVISVERVAAGLNESPDALLRARAQPPPPPPVSEVPAGHVVGGPTLEMPAIFPDIPDVVPTGSLPPGLKPSRVAPTIAGVLTGLIAIGLVLWVAGVFKPADDVTKPPLVVDAGSIAASTDAGVTVVTTTPSTDAGTLAVVYAGAAAGADAEADAGEAIVDAGGLIVDPPDVDEDAGPTRTNNGGGGGGRNTGPQKRVLAVNAPSWVQWQGRNGESYGSGKGTIRIPESVKTLVAYDTKRSGKTRIPVDKSTKSVDWSKLPKQELDIRVRPYAEVFLGKERLGVTPFDPVTVVAGVYEVKFVLKKQVKTQTVEVRPNRPAVITVVMK
jgi:serine/threonine-protein kinase